jgi:hypothetical protein
MTGKHTVLGVVTLIAVSVLASVGAVAAEEVGFVAGPVMNTPRMGHFSAVLDDGRVLALGGHTTSFQADDSCEILDAAQTAFSEHQMNATHDTASMVRLGDGTYLIAGGADDLGVAPGHASAEIYDPADDSFTATGVMVRARQQAGGCLLGDGRALFLGAWYTADSATYGEIYNPVTGTFSATSEVPVLAAAPLVLATDDGKAVMIGGYAYNAGAVGLTTVVQYDPSLDSFSILSDELFDGATGWTTNSANFRLNGDLELADGTYLFVAKREVSRVTEYALGVFDPASKQISRLATPQPLSPVGTFFLTPLIDLDLGVAYLVETLTVEANSEIRVHMVELASGWVIGPSWHDEIGYYPTYSGLSLLPDGRIVITGGHSGTGGATNYTPVTNTLIGYAGWYFGDGFEDGSTSAWSSAVD